MNFDDVTLLVSLSFIPVWAVWEAICAYRRAHPDGVRVKLISGVLKARGWQLSGVVFFYSSMATHWWWSAAWGEPWAAVLFWAIPVLLLAWNIASWKRTSLPLELWPRWLRWLNWPIWYVAAGALAGRFLFPQAGPTPWGTP